MHLRSFEITNIRALTKVQWEIPEGAAAGWHVIIGDNGSGKSTLLRALAVALIGAMEATALRQDWSMWLKHGEEAGTISVRQTGGDRLSLSQGQYLPGWEKIAPPFLGPDRSIRFVRIADDVKMKGSISMEMVHSSLTGMLDGQLEKIFRGAANEEDIKRLNEIWGKIRNLPDALRRRDIEYRSDHHWSIFSASFGPFRRFSGGNKDEERQFGSFPRIARHLTVFGENIALTECLSWLERLRFEELDSNFSSAGTLRQMKAFLNQPGLLPHGVRFKKVTSEGVFFVDGHGRNVPVTALGDGFRSLLSLTFELLRQMALEYVGKPLFEQGKPGQILVRHPGIVLIDEIDAHLHPTWQRQIGFWLTKHFPKVQFIVTTHSPLVCQAAENGTVFRLPKPGTDEVPEMVTGLNRDRLVFGSVLDAYGTELFGSDVSRSESAQQKQERLAELNQKAIFSGLTDAEKAERSGLQAIFPSSM